MSVRMTLQIDEALMERVRRLAPRGGVSRFVNEALAARVDAIERASIDRERIEREMVEGYIAQREDREQLNRDWETVDIEGWP
jgi:hypothetical protein